MVATLVERNVENNNSEVASLGHYVTVKRRGVCILGTWCCFTALQEGFCRLPHGDQHKYLSGCKHICCSLERANLSKRKTEFHGGNLGNTDWANSVPVFHRGSWWEPLFPACIKALSLKHKWHFCQIPSVNNFQ